MAMTESMSLAVDSDASTVAPASVDDCWQEESRPGSRGQPEEQLRRPSTRPSTRHLGATENDNENDEDDGQFGQAGQRGQGRELGDDVCDENEDEEEDDEDDDLDDLFFFSTPYTKQKCKNQRQLRLLDERQELPPLHPCPTEHQRPATSRSQLRVFHRPGGRSRSSSTSKQIRPSSGGRLQSHSSEFSKSKNMSKEEFAALPPTIQRKYFSTLERLRFAQGKGKSAKAGLASDARQDLSNRSLSSLTSFEEDIGRQTPETSNSSSDTLTLAPGPLRRVYSSTARLCTVPDESSQASTSDDGSDLYHTFISEATDEAVVRISKRRSQSLKQSSNTGEPNYTFFLQATMNSPIEDDNQSLEIPKPTEKPLDDCFRWLDGDSDLDLRLELRESQNKDDVLVVQKKRGLLFHRRQESSRLAKCAIQLASQPGTKDTTPSGPMHTPMTSSFPTPQSFSRRKSRTLSMIVPSSRAMTPEVSSGAVDPAACHYQDPETRMKLRVYLASPHKFDEAVEFGFPSINDAQEFDETSHTRSMSVSQESHHQATLKAVPHIEDEIASLCSDPQSPTETEFPKTPESMGRPTLSRAVRSSDDAIPTMAKIDYALAPASCREMTLRMTLTRPDLRADEDQMYGWQKSSRKLQSRDDPVPPRAYSRIGSNKDDIERQLAEIDHEVISNDNGVVKRFWNKVRRS